MNELRTAGIRAILWDLDGTIVDTEPLWIAAEAELAAEHGATWTDEDGLQLVGNALLETGRRIGEKLSSERSPEEIVDYLVERLAAALATSIDWRPGAAELVRALHAHGVPQALVTMSYAPIARSVTEALPFAAVVTGDVVGQGKPHPEPYLRAAEMLGVAPSACLAIEDSPTGAASATAAGCTVLVVPHMVPVPTGPRRMFRDTLAGLSPAGLRDLLRNP